MRAIFKKSYLLILPFISVTVLLQYSIKFNNPGLYALTLKSIRYNLDKYIFFSHKFAFGGQIRPLVEEY